MAFVISDRRGTKDGGREEPGSGGRQPRAPSSGLLSRERCG